MEPAPPFEELRTPNGSAAAQDTTGGLPRFCVIFALVLCIAALIAREAAIPSPPLFRSRYFHIQPLTMTGELLLSVAVLAAMHRVRLRLVAPLLVAAILLSAAAIAFALSLPPLGWHLPGYPLDALGLARPVPAHFGPVSGVILFTLAIAALLAIHGSHRTSQLAVLLASLTLGIAVIAGIDAPLAMADPADERHHALMSALAAGGAIALSAGLIGWRHRRGWPHLPWDRYARGAVPGVVLALCIITPASFALLRLWVIHLTTLSRPVAEALQVGAQVAVSTAILFWAWSRISGENVARREVIRALDAAPIAMVTTTGEIIHWSEGCERLYQWSAEQARGQVKHELLGSAIAGRWEALTEKLLDGHDWEEELVEHRRDGSPLFVLERARLMQGIDGRPPMIALSMTDITARTRAEEALHASDARLALAVEAQEIGIFEWEREGDVLSVSPVVEALAGMTAGGAGNGLAHWRRHLRSTFDIETFPSEAIGLRLQVPRFGFRMRRIGSDGNLVTIEGAVRCVYAPDGKLGRMIGVMFDTSERDQRAAALQARESELRTILEHVPDAMVTIDERGRIRSFSAAAEELLGYSAHEVIGSDVKLLMPARLYAPHDRTLQRRLDAGDPPPVKRRFRTTALHRDGTEITVELAVGEAEIGRERVFIGFLRNLSEQLAAQARLTELRDELVHVSRLSALGEMAAGLAHELNQPLAATANFLGAADMLLGDDEPAERDQVRSLARMASVQVLRAGEIIRRVRNFASRGAVEIQPEPLAEVLSDAVELLLTNAEWRLARIRFAFDPDHPLILADRVQIQQVIVNLVRNALEAISDRPEAQPDILIESRGAAKGMVEVLVKDNGPGIAPEVLQRQHAPFFSTKADGLGIGLSICRRIIESHGGTFVVENRPEGGAVTRFTVPSATVGELVSR